MANWIPGWEYTGLPGAPDADPNPDAEPVDTPPSSYGNTDLWEAVEGVGGNDGTGQSIVEATPIQLDENGGGIDLDQTLGVPELPWRLVGGALIVGVALWLLRPLLEIGAGVTN
ncbi:hypothetical protein LPA44_04085 [Halobacterium sp. KA-4]|uniref:hypothetical protein n=1 Tax=Halobacterium sp. KA-4 TaxID=2896367 RepID=UPI001E40487E|nr:hypothetical protein [Halobacterium sp. KA-4]MCD2199078.1 hypothetical protein [Halobacterium sp. KA-4]